MASSWKNPSAEDRAKYNLVALPEDFEPTEEEEALLAMYKNIRSIERRAARIKEQKAREKLAAKDAEFNQNNAPKKKTRRKKRERSAGDAGDGDEDDDEDDESVDEDMDGGSDDDTLQARRAEKLAQLREEVEEKKQTMAKKENQEEDLRKTMLETSAEGSDLGPLIKKKRTEPKEGTSTLLSGMKVATPPHEFSEKLELKPWKGKVLWPTSQDEISWSPPASAISPNDGAFLVELDNFDITKAQNGNGNNTLAMKFNAPSDSKRFSLNIAGPSHNEFQSVLFHFNPRQFEKGGQLVVNAKQDGTWGSQISLRLSQIPLIFGQTSVTLIIQINGDGFDIFLEGQHCARLEHRVELPSKPCSLFLQFPSCDDYGNLENWSVYKAWWGNKPAMAKGDLSGIAGVNSFNSVHPRKLFVSGLSRINTEQEVDVRRAELERAFRKYGGDRGVICIVPTNVTFAFVEMETDRQADLALAEMSSKYRLNRARRSRHEALQEERAAAEAAKKGVRKDTGGW